MLAKQPTTPAQVVAGVLGGLIVVVGLVGLGVNSSFHTGSALSTDKFFGVPVNGWDDLVPGVAFGLVLLAGAPRPKTARAACRLVALGYLVLLIAGLADGHTAFGFVPAATGDNVVRVILPLVLLWATAVSKDRRDTLSRDRLVVAPGDDPARVVGPGSGHVGGPRSISPRIDSRLPQKQHP